MNIHTLQIILILLAVAVLTVTLFKRFHLPPILGYLIVGILVGPFGTGVIAFNEETRFPAESGVGHTIEDLHLWDWDVSITAVRRGGIRGEAPAPETRLQAGDVLVLAGTAHPLEHAEGLLLYAL
ncbi:MAG: TrkA C-terminal domain-containing protein [Candidatus Thiodiazotropha sp.]